MDSSEFRLKVGNRIKQLRQEAKMTQAEVAKKAGININYFAVIERGEVTTSVEKLKKIGDALKVDISKIIG